MKKLVIIFLLLSSTTCWGKWTFVVENKNGNEFFVDLDNIKRVGNSLYVWELQNFDKPFLGRFSAVTYTEFNCDTFGFRYLEMIVYKEKLATGDMKKIPLEQEQREWQFTPPSSSNYRVTKFVCSYN